MRVAILGTGLIGTSIGLRLRQRQRDWEVIGHDRYRDNAKAAEKAGAFTKLESSPQLAVRGADVVVLAAPVLAVRQLMETIGPELRPDTIVTDTASTKAEVMRWARQLLPDRVHFIGGHPMAGKTEAGPQAAEPGLFEGARWVVVAPPGAPEGAIESVRTLVEMTGAEPMLMDAEEHDAYVAAVSHLPLVAATALFRLARDSEAWPELSLLAAGGFKDTTRLAGTDPAMSFDIVATNREQIVHWLDRFRGALLELRQRLTEESDPEGLYKYLAETEFQYVGFRSGQVGRQEKGPDATDSGFDFSSFLIGQALRDKLSQLNRDAEERERDRRRR